MLRQVAEGVLVHESDFMRSNAVIVHGEAGVLVVDAGIRGDELAGIANDLRASGHAVAAGFSTHPHWDHLLWHAGLGAAPRYGTARCAAAIEARLSDENWNAMVGGMLPPEIADEVPLDDLFGRITGLPAQAARIPWSGPEIRIIEHQAHAPGHAALLIEDRGALVAGDMLSDVLIPMLDLNGAADPIGDYLTALRLLEGVAGGVDVVIPATDPSAAPTSCTHASTGIGRTCTPCATAGSRATRGWVRRPSPAGNGWPTCTPGRCDASRSDEHARLRFPTRVDGCRRAPPQRQNPVSCSARALPCS
ncbi:MBL fold metallo-hydrolase [Agromyces tardus]|uniref:MBL fold metallo-hydrolase n=1 Tax=Agromyces tardus TaxID=2583849 RepID=UPI001FE27EAC|nr:MBL fold metallo-hydrolase [Agromyces tardus]